MGQPLLVGVSRKAFIGKILELDPAGRLEGSLAAAVAAVLAGANIVRVHDVARNLPRRADRRRDPLRLPSERGIGRCWSSSSQIRWQDLLDIGIITFLVYRSLQIVRGSRAMQMIIGLAVILVAYVSSRALGLFTLNWILDNFLGSIILVIIVIFQSDIRRALTQVGSAPLFVAAERMCSGSEDIIEEVAQAAMALAAKHVGALIVLQREVGLERIHGNRHAARRPGEPGVGRKRLSAPFADPRWRAGDSKGPSHRGALPVAA